MDDEDASTTGFERSEKGKDQVSSDLMENVHNACSKGQTIPFLGVNRQPKNIEIFGTDQFGFILRPRGIFSPVRCQRVWDVEMRGASHLSATADTIRQTPSISMYSW